MKLRAQTSPCRFLNFTYVDNFVFLAKRQTADALGSEVTEVLNVFKSCGDDLNFMHEEPIRKHLLFLNLKLTRMRDHICLMYEPRSKKDIVSFSSAHSKISKRGIACVCLYGSLWVCHRGNPVTDTQRALLSYHICAE